LTKGVILSAEQSQQAHRSKYQAMVNEVKTFIENAPEFK
jgi:hypothetical protein